MKALEEMQVVKAVQEMMRSRYGFRCDDGDWRKINDRKKVYEFLPEKPTGQAAFFQKEVQVGVEYNEEDKPIAMPTVSVSVSYDVFSGHNGNSVDYAIITDSEPYDDPEVDRKILYLIPMRYVWKLQDLRMLQNKMHLNEKAAFAETIKARRKKR